MAPPDFWAEPLALAPSPNLDYTVSSGRNWSGLNAPRYFGEGTDIMRGESIEVPFESTCPLPSIQPETVVRL